VLEYTATYQLKGAENEWTWHDVEAWYLSGGVAQYIGVNDAGLGKEVVLEFLQREDAGQTHLFEVSLEKIVRRRTVFLS
jgi:hypothetical protein